MRLRLTSRRAQSTAEYAVVIAIVLAAAVGMQTYVKRALQAKIHGAAGALVAVNGDATNNLNLGNMEQYEPYYAESNYNVNRQDRYNETITDATVSYSGDLSNTLRTGSSNEGTNVNGDDSWQ